MICDLLVCSAILLALVEWLGDDAIDFTSAAVVAFLGIGAATGVGWSLRPQIGDLSFIVGLVVAAVIVGMLLLVKYGVEVKRAFLIGGLFVAGCLVWRFGLSALISAII